MSPADKGVHVDSVPKRVLIFLAQFSYIVVFVPLSKNTILAPKRHFVNNLRPVTEVSRALVAEDLEGFVVYRFSSGKIGQLRTNSRHLGLQTSVHYRSKRI